MPILIFPFFLFKQIYSAESFLIFPVSSSACNKKTFIKKISGHRLSFKIDAIDGKKWVNSPTLIYDLNTTKGTVGESPLKMHSHSKQCSSKPEKSHLFLEVSNKKKENEKKNKQETVLSHLKVLYSQI